MNEGMISTRYARAILSFAKDKKAEESVYIDMKKIVSAFSKSQDLRTAFNNPVLSIKQKRSLLEAILENSPSEIMQRVFDLVSERERFSKFFLIAQSYIATYRKLKNINLVKLVIADKPDEKTIEQLKVLSSKIRDGVVDFDIDIDKRIDGGFILYVDTFRLDASVKSQLENIRNKLILENSKL